MSGGASRRSSLRAGGEVRATGDALSPVLRRRGAQSADFRRKSADWAASPQITLATDAHFGRIMDSGDAIDTRRRKGNAHYRDFVVILTLAGSPARRFLRVGGL